MILKMFCVYDSKVGAYLPPMFFRSNGEALRAFASAANDVKHDFYRYASDYTLFEIGAFHDDSAVVNSLSTPKSLGLAIEYLSKDDSQYCDVSGAKLGIAG